METLHDRRPEKRYPEKFSFKKRLVSFRYAFNGLKIFVKEEHNAILHIFITCCVLIAAVKFKVSTVEWIAIIFCIALVLALELVNSAIENTADLISKEENDTIKKIKDLSAGAVLIAAIASAAIGLIIFIPKL